MLTRAITAAVLCVPLAARAADSQTLFDPASPCTVDCDLARPDKLADGWRFSVAPKRTVSIRFKPVDKTWDVSAFTRLQFDWTLDAPEKCAVVVGLHGKTVTTAQGFIRPGRGVFNVFFFRAAADRSRYPQLSVFHGMNGLPGGFMTHWSTVDPADVHEVTVDISPTDRLVVLKLKSVRATDPVVPEKLRTDPAGFFPFVDSYGQYRWAEWPGKVHTDGELKAGFEKEAAAIAAAPRPPAWDRFGGDAAGPLLKATGSFRTEKVAGKWWLVDPAGRLFWSHGADCVGYNSGATPTKGREDYFQFLPPRDGDFSAAWRGDVVNLLSVNLRRQMGPDCTAAAAALAHRRLAHWGMNTIGNWSTKAICQADQTPYTLPLGLGASPLFDGMPDAMDPEFPERADANLAKGAADSRDDPWCIGYFVDNELHWGDAAGFTAAVLGAPANRAAKKDLVRRLRSAYPNLADFAAAVHRDFGSWDAVLANTRPVETSNLRKVSDEFYRAFCDQYFSTVAAAVHKAAPGKLYLGCRMNHFNPAVVRSAGTFCDVLSFNLYQSAVAEFKPFDVDAPCLISEFHFGSLDRGSLATGLVAASDQQDRADKYTNYVRGALTNPSLVGTHWFAYCPQPITGRGDGENYDDGLVTVCNLPYPELDAAVQNVGWNLYAVRK